MPMEDAVLDSKGRPFHSLAPQKENYFCLFAEFFLGNRKLVSLFRRLREKHTELW